MYLTLTALQAAISLPITGALAAISLGLRLWSRSIAGTTLAFNDYAVIIAMVIVLGVIANALYGVFIGGVGIHMSEIEATKPWIIEAYLKASLHILTAELVAYIMPQSFLAAEFLWSGANTCVKTSILSLYTVIFPVKNFRLICYTLMGITVVYFISVVVEAFAICKPVAFSWDKTIEGGTCPGQSAAFLGAGVMNLALDLIIWIIPMPMLFNLQLSMPKKLGVASMFSLGAVICIISLLRVLWLVNLDLTDLTYGVGPGTIYSALEPILGVINACLPTIKPAVLRIIRIIIPSWANYAGSLTQKSSVTDSKSHKVTSADTAPYRQLDDNIPLNNLQRQGGIGNIGDANTIIITQEWSVNTSTQSASSQPDHW
ncbi:hypothetical protein O1611_g2804 [Lasiodiplodia mahajangana]|uniref:Uncharacterized protein n=1 Tax=Lasiodiplodia mahajangana TaxID=1108764 RepID=A0ACC2JTH7_9PEZI|nr:hypothetical protein O1611_g2804 [Lasiodiplodia mahajangana]